MKAGRIIAPETIEIIQTDRPDVALEATNPDGLRDKVLIRTLITAVCGSDHPSFLGDGHWSSFPSAPGGTLHECIGLVEKTWSDTCKEGDLVLAVPGGYGAMAEYFLGQGQSVVQVPDGLPKEQLLMAQPLGTVIYCLRKMGHLFNREVAILGQGPMGLLFTGMLKNLGAEKIIGIDQHKNRLEAALEMGATHTVDASEVDPIEAVTDITEGRLADLVVEVVGEEDTFNTCIKLARHKADFINFGVPRKSRYSIDIGELFRKNLRLTTSVGPDVHIDYGSGMRMIAEGRINVFPLITHTVPFARVQEAFELATKRKHEAIKVIVDYEEGSRVYE